MCVNVRAREVGHSSPCVTQDFTRQEAVLAFTFSRMSVVDELKSYSTWITLSLTDFLEALARVATMISMPTEEDMEAMEAENAFL